LIPWTDIRLQQLQDEPLRLKLAKILVEADQAKAGGDRQGGQIGIHPALRGGRALRTTPRATPWA
jgi:hypothetical protein